MLLNGQTIPAGRLVDGERGTVSREIFVNAEIYQQEQEQVFTRAWLFVGHESHIPNPGDYFTSYMGEDPVLVSRDRDGQIHVFLNSCRHRGMKVCRYDDGSASLFTCPYHGWSYGTDGKLVGVPRLKEGYYGEFDKSQWGLVEVAQLHNYKGTLWATWDPAAPAFLDYLGAFKVFLDGLLDGSDGSEAGSEALPGIYKWRMPSNWKFVSENFAGDHYHHVSHLSVEAVGIGPARIGETRHGAIANYRAHLTSFPELGHCWRGGPPQPVDDTVYPFAHFESPLVEAHFQQANERRKQRAQQTPPVWLFGGGGNVFPNASFHVGYPRTIIVAQPRGPMQTELWRWFLIDKDCPEEAKELFRHYYMRYAGPAGMTEQDDMENWSYATAASKGPIARRYPYNYQQALGHAQPYDGLAGALVTDGEFGETNALTLYGRWAAYMDAESWAEL